MTDLKADYKDVTDPKIWTGIEEDKPGDIPTEPKEKEPETFETNSVTFVIYEGELWPQSVKNEI